MEIIVHTVELSALLTNKEYDYLSSLGSGLKNRLAIYGIRNIRISSNGYDESEVYGNINASTNQSKPIHRCWMSVNLSRVANDGQPTVAPFQCTDTQISNLYRNFKEFMSIIFSSKSKRRDLAGWYVIRIDYCINIKTEYVSEYIELFQRGDKPYNMTFPTSYAKEQNKAADDCSHKPGSVYFVNGSRHINIYDKRDKRKKELEYQRLKTGDELLPEDIEELERYKDILRLEVQILLPGTNYLKNKHGMPDKELLNFLSIPDEARKMLCDAYRRICGCGDYYSHKKAIEIITDSNKHKRTKEGMIKALKLIKGSNNTGSIRTARKRYNATRDGALPAFDTVIAALNDVGVNPITLGKKTKPAFLQSLYNTVNECCDMFGDEIE